MKWRFQIERTASMEFTVIPTVMFSVIFPIVMGALLRLPQFIIDIKGNKKWNFDWARFFGVGLPTLLILIYYTLSFIGLIPAIHLVLISGSTLATISGIVFGYILLDNLENTSS